MADIESQKRSQIFGWLGVGDHLVDPKFYRNRSRYLYQCGFVAITVLIVLLVLDAVYQSVLIAALGASSMVAFSAPNMRASRPRCMIGGYIAGIIVGCSISLLIGGGDYGWISADLAHILAGAVATGLAMFCMVTTDTEHPPAAALALGFVLNDWDFMTVLGVLSGIALIVVIKESFRGRLVDLL